jgi:DNA-binding HxlR family transcriptional regulator
MELIGSRWTATIIRALLGGVTQFSGLRQAIPGISDRMLSERLRELEREGIVERTVIADTPVRIEYRLTEKGAELSPVMNSMIEWLSKWGDRRPTPFEGC